MSSVSEHGKHLLPIVDLPASRSEAISSTGSEAAQVAGRKLRFDSSETAQRKKTRKQYLYVIDVVGTCNLRCPSCPVGNMQEANRATGFMDAELYEAILDKIAHESPAEVTDIT